MAGKSFTASTHVSRKNLQYQLLLRIRDPHTQPTYFGFFTFGKSLLFIASHWAPGVWLCRVFFIMLMWMCMQCVAMLDKEINFLKKKNIPRAHTHPHTCAHTQINVLLKWWWIIHTWSLEVQRRMQQNVNITLGILKILDCKFRMLVWESLRCCADLPVTSLEWLNFYLNISMNIRLY